MALFQMLMRPPAVGVRRVVAVMEKLVKFALPTHDVTPIWSIDTASGVKVHKAPSKRVNVNSRYDSRAREVKTAIIGGHLADKPSSKPELNGGTGHT